MQLPPLSDKAPSCVLPVAIAAGAAAEETAGCGSVAAGSVTKQREHENSHQPCTGMHHMTTPHKSELPRTVAHRRQCRTKGSHVRREERELRCMDEPGVASQMLPQAHTMEEEKISYHAGEFANVCTAGAGVHSRCSMQLAWHSPPQPCTHELQAVKQKPHATSMSCFAAGKHATTGWACGSGGENADIRHLPTRRFVGPAHRRPGVPGTTQRSRRRRFWGSPALRDRAILFVGLFNSLFS